MSRQIKMTKEAFEALLGFYGSFYLVFENDWGLTLSRIVSEFSEDSKATFINPLVADESNNWANRGSLLSSYRRVEKILGIAGENLMEPDEGGDLIPDYAVEGDAYWRDLTMRQQETIAKLTAMLAEGRALVAAPVRSGGRTASKTA